MEIILEIKIQLDTRQQVAVLLQILTETVQYIMQLTPYRKQLSLYRIEKQLCPIWLLPVALEGNRTTESAQSRTLLPGFGFCMGKK